jgi:hypothetical protein
MSADEKRKLFAIVRLDVADPRLRYAATTIDRAGDVLCAEIARLKAEIAAERANCGPACRHG